VSHPRARSLEKELLLFQSMVCHVDVVIYHYKDEVVGCGKTGLFLGVESWGVLERLINGSRLGL
jgi:hypothetical protein